MQKLQQQLDKDTLLQTQLDELAKLTQNFFDVVQPDHTNNNVNPNFNDMGIGFNTGLSNYFIEQVKNNLTKKIQKNMRTNLRDHYTITENGIYFKKKHQ